MHTDLEIQVPTVENLALSNVLHLRPGVGQNVAMHASPTAINDNYKHSVLSLCVQIIIFMLLVLLMVVLLTLLIVYVFLFLHFFLSAHLYFFLR